MYNFDSVNTSSSSCQRETVPHPIRQQDNASAAFYNSAARRLSPQREPSLGRSMGRDHEERRMCSPERSFEQAENRARTRRSRSGNKADDQQQRAQSAAAAAFSPAIKAQAAEQLPEDVLQLSLATPARDRWGTSRHSLPAAIGNTPDKVKQQLDEPSGYSQSAGAKFASAIKLMEDPAHRNALILRWTSLFIEKAVSEQVAPPETVFSQLEVRVNAHPVFAVAPLPLKIQQHVDNVEVQGGRVFGGHFFDCYEGGQIPYTVLDISASGVYCLEVGDQKEYKTCFPTRYKNISTVLENAMKDQEKLIAVGKLASGSQARYVRLGKEKDHLSFAVVHDREKGGRATIYPLYCIHLLTREQPHYRVGKGVLTYAEIKEEINWQYENENNFPIFYYKNSEGKLCAIFDVGPAFKKRTLIPCGVCFVREVTDMDPGPAQPASSTINQ